MTAATDDAGTDMESVDSFRLRARGWLAANMRPGSATFRPSGTEEEELAFIEQVRALQRKYYEGGFAGICFAEEYGGQGLTPAHQRAFNEEVSGYEFPHVIQVPTFVPCAAVLYEFGTEEQKKEHLPKMMAGEEIFMQLLSEPSGGSDVAGALMTAVRDGDEWVLNGSKIWTSGAYYSDYGLALVRTNWDVPKHRGLTVFIVELRQPGVEIHRIEMLNGSREFCQEFFTDVRIPDTDRLGEVDDGWTVGTRWMFHERNAMGGGSPYLSGTRLSELESMGSSRDRLFAIAERNGDVTDPLARDRVGEGIVLSRASRELSQRIGEGMAAGVFSDAAAAITRLMSGVVGTRRATLGLELAGPAIAASSEDDPAAFEGQWYLNRQAGSIGGGTTEMARNNISERVLGMPREVTHDKNMPYRDVPKGPPAKG